MNEQRLALVQLIRSGVPLSVAARRWGVSRKTAYKWVDRAGDPGASGEPSTLDLDAFLDRSRAPCCRPLRAAAEVEAAVVACRLDHGWGARKVHASLAAQGLAVPSIRTVHEVFRRHGLLASDELTPGGPGAVPVVRFQREAPNQLWQIDFKKPSTEVARTRPPQFTALDDHSRYLLACPFVPDLALRTAWDVLWRLFGEVGIPDAILSDNAFSVRHQPATISWFDAQLIRLGIDPLHGRPYHPQTQGKIERLHGTLERECYPRARRDCLENFARDCEAWRQLYNHHRPHEALGDQPPSSHWRPSLRPRPSRLPEVTYPDGTITRRVCPGGNIQFNNFRITAGQGLAGQYVAIEDRTDGLLIRFAHVTVRHIPSVLLRRGTIL